MGVEQKKIPVSVLIPAKNEEKNIQACMDSVADADEVFLVDSQSSDRTIAIAEEKGAKVVQFHYNGKSPKKKNWSFRKLTFQKRLGVDC